MQTHDCGHIEPLPLKSIGKFERLQQPQWRLRWWFEGRASISISLRGNSCSKSDKNDLENWIRSRRIRRLIGFDDGDYWNLSGMKKLWRPENLPATSLLYLDWSQFVKGSSAKLVWRRFTTLFIFYENLQHILDNQNEFLKEASVKREGERCIDFSVQPKIEI